MSEIHELNPKPERQPAEAPITPGQLALYIAARGAGRPCEACGGKDWRAHDEGADDTTALMLMRRGAPGGPSGSKPTVTLICRNCGLIRQFVRAVVARWVEESRRG